MSNLRAKPSELVSSGAIFLHSAGFTLQRRPCHVAVCVWIEFPQPGIRGATFVRVGGIEGRLGQAQRSVGRAMGIDEVEDVIIPIVELPVGCGIPLTSRDDRISDLETQPLD
jgi:hypothetical protein